MTIKELMAEFQDMIDHGVDPETPVCAGNYEVYFAEIQPAYYDGRLQRIVIDPAKRPYYSIVGAKVTAEGNKCSLHCLGVESVVFDNPDIPVDLSELGNKEDEQHWKKRIEEWRAESRAIEEHWENKRHDPHRCNFSGIGTCPTCGEELGMDNNL